MPAPTSLACWTNTTEDEQNYWIYVAVGGTEVSLACFVNAPYDEQRWLIFQQLGGGGSPVIVVTAPTSLSDASMFPGGVFPATGEYLAMDINWIYSYNAAVDTEWQQTSRSN